MGEGVFRHYEQSRIFPISTSNHELQTNKTMNHTENLNRCSVSARSNGLTLLCVALALAGCGKPATKSPEKSLVRTAVVQPMDNVRSECEASYLAAVKFDQETDLSFKV